MTSAFEKALAQTLFFEGGLSDHPADRGGRTKWGITQRTYDAWRVTTGQGTRPVDELADAEMRAIYRDNYWAPCKCEQLPQQVAAAVFDMAVNSGPGAAIRTLQRSLGVAVDGVIGPKTIDAAARHGSTIRFLKSRGAFLQEVIEERPDQVVFLEGWINRLLDQAWRPL